MDSLDTIQGFDISFSDYSKRIINIKIEDEIIDKLIFHFKRFNRWKVRKIYKLSFKR